MKKQVTTSKPALKDLSVKNAKAQDVSGGISLAYGSLQVEYKPQTKTG